MALPDFVPAGQQVTNPKAPHADFIPAPPVNVLPEIDISADIGAPERVEPEDVAKDALDPSVLASQGICPYCDTDKFLVGGDVTAEDIYKRYAAHIRAAHPGQSIPELPEEE